MRGHFDNRHGELEEELLKSGRTFSIFIDVSESNWVRKKSLLPICKVLNLLLNALTGRDNYALRNRDNLQQPFHMRVSHKEEIFSQCFFLCISEIYIKF